MVADHYLWPFCDFVHGIQSRKPDSIILLTVEFAEAWFHAQRHITCGAYASCPLLTADSAWKLVPLWAYGGQLQLAVRHPAHAFCEPEKQLYAFVCSDLQSAAWSNIGEIVADHIYYHSVCPHSTK